MVKIISTQDEALIWNFLAKDYDTYFQFVSEMPVNFKSGFHRGNYYYIHNGQKVKKHSKSELQREFDRFISHSQNIAMRLTYKTTDWNHMF